MPRDRHSQPMTLQRARHGASEVSRPASRRRMPRLTLSHTWVVLALVLPAIVLLGLSLSAVDLAYHIRAGNIMLRTHHVIRTDTFSFTAFGRPWLDQQWGAQILLALLYRLGGWSLLVFVRSLCGAVVVVLVFLTCRARGATMKQGAWLALASGAVVVGGLMPRPQLFGLLLFALTVWILSWRVRRPRLVFMIPAIVAVWANLHGSFFLGPLL